MGATLNYVNYYTIITWENGWKWLFFAFISFEMVTYIEVKLICNSHRMFIAVLSCSGARIFVRYGRLNAIFAKIALARSFSDSVISYHSCIYLKTRNSVSWFGLLNLANWLEWIRGMRHYATPTHTTAHVLALSTQTHARTHARTHAYMHACAHEWAHTRAHTNTWACSHAHTFACKYTCTTKYT